MRSFRFVLAIAASFACLPWASADHVTDVGGSAPAFSLQAAAGTQSGTVTLDSITADGPAVVVVLRGFPGYQCPLCTRQVGQFLSKAKQFEAKGTSVLFVYPGPASNLNGRAAEFLRGTTLPKPFTLVLDPDYTFTNAYHLRWNAPRETAYPTTLVVDQDGKILFSKVSKGHGGRTSPDEILSKLP